MGLFRIKLLSQLLCDGTSTTRTGTPQQSSLNEGTTKGEEVDARMVVETDVLGGYQGMNQVWRKGVIRYAYAVFAILVPCSNHLTIGRIYLRSKAVDGVLQFGYGWHVAYPAVPNGYESQHGRKHAKH